VQALETLEKLRQVNGAEANWLLVSANKNNHQKGIRARPEFIMSIVKIRDPVGVYIVAKITNQSNVQKGHEPDLWLSTPH